MRDEAETALFTLPSGIKELQAISVVPARRPAELDPNLVMITDPYSKRADAYRALRRKLAAGSTRIIAITSAKPKEGKTICAINLAYALAESSPRNILVVEANIRSPGLAATLKLDPQICFTEQLRRRRKDEDEPWIVVDQSGTGPVDDVSGAPSMRGGAVHLLAVDPKAERPPMLDAVAFSKGMKSLKRAGYEYIIVDTPAVLGTLDMQIIGDAVDGVIFTSIVKRSTRRPLKDAIEQIKPAPVLGVIVLEG
jgi:Mrp family chromosome partitioning ATPase